MQRRWFVALTVVVLLFAAGALVQVGGASSADTPQQDTEEPPQLGTPAGFNSTVFEVTLYENSSARWTIRHRRPLETEEERSQFASFAETFNSTETETFTTFQSRTQALTDFAAEETGREMNATDYRKNAEIREGFQNPVGVMEMSFTWEQFSRTTDRGVVVDDVFEGGMYVGRGQELTMIRADGLVFEDVEPSPDQSDVEGNVTASQSVTWTGEQEFADQRPRLVVVRADALGENTTENGTSPGATTGQLGPLPVVVAVLLLLVLGGLIAWYSGGLEGLIGGSDDSGGAAAERTDSTVTEEAAPAEPTVPEEELLSDEDRVLKLLDENGGRMKQVNIVEETEWSKSKVSMLLSDMEDDGLISKLRVGRENIISKAGEEPDAVGSPFDDE